jgi:hypothetical protein
MATKPIHQCDAIRHFEPLMPTEAGIGPLLERASDLTRAATALGTASGQAAQRELRALLRSMNSYYSNRIEGEHTRPSDIERALLNDFPATPIWRASNGWRLHISMPKPAAKPSLTVGMTTRMATRVAARTAPVKQGRARSPGCTPPRP